MGAIIEVKGVSKSFRGTKVLDDITATFEQGKIHGIVGRNGSGKTLLIKTICGFIRPDTGTVIVAGKTVGADMAYPKGIGAVIEAPGFLPTHSGYANLRYLASLQNTIGPEQIRRAIRQVGLDPDDKKHVGKYSMGMKQRLGLAQAIMEDPDILILDEPMNNLDEQGVEDVRRLLLDLKKNGKTILLATHVAEDIRLLCDTVRKISGGRMTEQ